MAKTKTNDVRVIEGWSVTDKSEYNGVEHDTRDTYAQALYDERSKAKAPQYTRQGPPIQMQDVLLAFGELNERECMIVQWVLDKVNALPWSNGLTVAEVMDVVGPLCLGDATSSAIRSKLTAIRQSKSK